ncbi:MAG: fibronectin type III domain-containing protein, partial [Chitinophagia bacterium]|nr:fibronectin type III domain-containing protein [Chitinophagia bacterium]
GLSIASIDISATPFTVPNQITAVVATPRDRQVDLSWNAPFNGGRNISNYLVKVYTDSFNWDILANTTDTSYNVTGLINGIGYRFNISAINDAGLSIASIDISATPFTIPSAPIITATAGNALVDLSWNAPSSNGRDISSYIIQTSPDSIAWTTDSSTNATTRFKQLTGLTNGVKYYFRVFATNVAGDSSSSNEKSAIPFTVPDAPTDVLTDVSGISGQANVRWTAQFNGGSDISSYIVTSSPIGGIATINFVARTATVTGLTDGSNYTFTVKARNVAGDSLESIASTPVVMPYTVPNQIESITLVYGNNRVDLSWNAPFNGGRDISDYLITAFFDLSNVSFATFLFTTTFANFTGGVNGQLYRINISARNIAGFSIPSVDVYFTPFTVPDQIIDPIAIPRDRQVDLSWNAPFNGGRDISNYLIKVYTDLSNWDIFTNTIDTSYNVTGLINGTRYRFNIFARNIGGLSIASTDILATPFTVPNQITTAVAIPRDKQVDLSWNAPFNGGIDISNYLIKVYTDISNWDISTNTTDTSYNVTGLINGTGYRFNISARNIAGLSI